MSEAWRMDSRIICRRRNWRIKILFSLDLAIVIAVAVAAASIREKAYLLEKVIIFESKYGYVFRVVQNLLSVPARTYFT